MSSKPKKTERTADNYTNQPVASYKSKQVVLTAQRHDPVKITNIFDIKEGAGSIPKDLDVIQRFDSFFGPDIRLKDETGTNYKITAPGPDRHLFLWLAKTDKEGFCKEWSIIAEVEAKFGEDLPSYDKCPECNGVIKSAAHERAAIFGYCSKK